MKILMTLETPFPPDTRVENEIETLLKAGYEVHLICNKNHSIAAKHHKALKIHYLTPNKLIRKSSVGALKIPIYFMYWKKKLRRVLKQHSFDVVHVHDLPLIKPVSQLRNKFSFKIVLDLHENWPALLNVTPYTKTLAGQLLCSIKQWEDYEKKYLPVADRIIVVVEEAKQRIQSLSIDLPEVYVVSNTINLNDLLPGDRQRKANKEKTIFVYEGGVTYHRGLQNVINAFAKIGDPRKNAEMWIIGDGSYLSTLKKLSGSLNLNDTVKFFGWQPQVEVFKLVGSADFALIPHIKSPQTDASAPHKLFHYMYMNVPLIASNCNSIERIIKETSTGYIYKHENLDELSKLIEHIIKQETHFTSRGKSWVLKKYNWKEDAIQLLKLYESLA